jgi:uncharacterized membrane-anchored protein
MWFCMAALAAGVDEAGTNAGEQMAAAGGIDAALEAAPPEPWVAELEAWVVEQGVAPEEARETARQMKAFEDGIAWQTGRVSLRDGAMALDLAEGDRYAGPADASKILEAWGNLPDATTDGLLLPSGAHLFGRESWAVIVQFTEDGWVDDADAGSIDYDELLASMREGEEAANEQRRELGLDTLTLAGWAESPHYDAATRVLYWATLARSADGATSLNYDVRVLGRRGVLSLNAVADGDALAQIKTSMERVRTLATFQPGHTYTDYVAGEDRKAEYGIGALIAGGALAAGAKTGLFKGLFAALLASKKLIVAGVVGGAAALRGLWAAVTRGRAAQE